MQPMSKSQPSPGDGAESNTKSATQSAVQSNIVQSHIVRELKALVRDVPDFPSPGILFRDITPILRDPGAFRKAVNLFLDALRHERIDVFAGIESRGFVFAPTLALETGAGFVPVRKQGKLPADTVQRSYALEYGEATLEVHRDAIQPGQRVAIVDDLLATGGTAQATVQLVEELGGQVVRVLFLIELEALGGRARLAGYPVTSFLHY